MEVNLENLIEKVRTEAVDQGRQQADKIVADAKAEAEKIVADAQAESKKIIDIGRREAEQLQANARQAVRQAARDAELLLKERLNALFDRVFKRQIGTALTVETLNGIIRQLVTDWAARGQVDIAVSEADKDGLQELLFAGLQEELQDAVTLRASSAVSSGFRFELKGGSVYYDFTDETIAETLRAFINPGLQGILNGDDG